MHKSYITGVYVVAGRISSERGENIGDSVGYKVITAAYYMFCRYACISVYLLKTEYDNCVI